LIGAFSQVDLPRKKDGQRIAERDVRGSYAMDKGMDPKGRNGCKEMDWRRIGGKWICNVYIHKLGKDDKVRNGYPRRDGYRHEPKKGGMDARRWIGKGLAGNGSAMYTSISLGRMTRFRMDIPGEMDIGVNLKREGGMRGDGLAKDWREMDLRCIHP